MCSIELVTDIVCLPLVLRARDRLRSLRSFLVFSFKGVKEDKSLDF